MAGTLVINTRLLRKPYSMRISYFNHVGSKKASIDNAIGNERIMMLVHSAVERKEKMRFIMNQRAAQP